MAGLLPFWGQCMQVPKPVRMGYEEKTNATPVQVGDDLWEMHGAGARLLEFCAGRSVGDYERMEVLRAAVTMLLDVMDAAARRVERHSAETAARLSGVGALHEVMGRLGAEGDASGEGIWRFIESGLPELVGSAAEELQRWHEG